MKRRGLLPMAASLLTAVALAGCADTANMGEPICRQDMECPPDHGCTGNACVPKAMAMTRAWALEVVPKAEARAAHTEHPSVIFDAQPRTLLVDTKESVGGVVNRDPLDLEEPLATARVIVLLPSMLPGKRERLFETQGTSKVPLGPIEFLMRVPDSLLGLDARLRLVPGQMVERFMPPWTSEFVPLKSSMAFTMPKGPELYLIDGTLLEALREPVVGYVVRAFIADRVVSNVARTDEAGRFRLRIPKGPAADIRLSEISIELSPANATAAQPRLMVRGLSENKLNLGELKLPAYPRPQMLDVPVAGAGSTSKIAGATLRVYALLPGAVGGEAFFRREAQTDSKGLARIALLPGSGTEAREYSVAVIPPAQSTYAARCVPKYSVAAGPDGSVRVGASIELAPKAMLSGTIVTADGTPASGIGIAAYRVPRGDTFVAACATEVASPAPTTTSKRDGTYSLLLEPGQYRIEYDPPAGAASPPFADGPIVVSSERSLLRQVVLPAGVLVEGVLKMEGGMAVPDADVRAFLLPTTATTSTATSELRGRARSGSDGRFRMVLPR